MWKMHLRSWLRWKILQIQLSTVSYQNNLKFYSLIFVVTAKTANTAMDMVNVLKANASVILATMVQIVSVPHRQKHALHLVCWMCAVEMDIVIAVNACAIADIVEITVRFVKLALGCV